MSFILTKLFACLASIQRPTSHFTLSEERNLVKQTRTSVYCNTCFHSLKSHFDHSFHHHHRHPHIANTHCQTTMRWPTLERSSGSRLNNIHTEVTHTHIHMNRLHHRHISPFQSISVCVYRYDVSIVSTCIEWRHSSVSYLRLRWHHTHCCAYR